MTQPFNGTVLNAAVATPTVQRGRVVSVPSADHPLTYPTKTIAGYVLNSLGNEPEPVEGALCMLIRQSDGVKVAEQFSGPNGFYSFVRDANDTNTYYVVAFSFFGGTTQVHGTSNNGLVPI